MDYLWGEFLPVPADKITSVGDGEKVKVEDMSFMAIHTPGHASHHISWLLEETCFTGDVGGIRIPGVFYIRMPLVPPELDFEKWRKSIAHLMDIGFKNIAPTHFGIFNDARAHLTMALQLLDENEQWMEQASIDDTPIELLREQYATFLHDQGISLGVSEETLQISEIANPPRMGADGIQRYWNKHLHSN
jgi:glyoxylase-like metal-dependent hydrolase (beta-lactamase superfamily II)